jgi:hypothetical protein
MASSDDFKQKLKAGNLTEALALALSEAIELKITTWVASIDGDAAQREPDHAKPGYRLRTRINMMEGDIENEVGDQFIGNGPYRELRQFHTEQVAKGGQTIQNNLKSLEKLFGVLAMMRQQSLGESVIEPDQLFLQDQLLLDTDATTSAPEDFLSTVPVVEPFPETGITPAPEESFSQEDFFDTAPVIESFTRTDNPVSPEETGREVDVFTSAPVVEYPELDITIAPEETPREEDLSTTTPEVEAFTDTEVASPEETFREEDVSSPVPEVAVFIDTEITAPEETPSEEDDLAIAHRAELVTELPEVVVESLVTEEEETQPTAFPAEPTLNGAPIADELYLEEEEEEDNWDDSVLDLLESLPVIPPGESAAEWDDDEDWGDMVEEQEELELSPDVAAAHQEDNQDWEIFSLEDLELLPEEEASDAPDDEGWEEPIDAEVKSMIPEASIPNLDSLDLEADEDWDDWEEVPAPAQPSEAVPSLDSLDLEAEEEWDEFGIDADDDPFGVSSALNHSTPELDEDEDWESFSVEELEPYPVVESSKDRGVDDLGEPTKDSPLDELDRFLPMTESGDRSEPRYDNPIEMLFDGLEEELSEEESEEFSWQDNGLEEQTPPNHDPSIPLMSEEEQRMPPSPSPDRYPNENN